ncbi:unnamed protein product [Gulo gulo]|uniref:Uncharacterized protein n=1 Tax=Gulo gulo TaxID=48420 RepID=A0A9X9PY02_GULGU|nr:unnamed protein product [Gulo gulo]
MSTMRFYMQQTCCQHVMEKGPLWRFCKTLWTFCFSTW